MKKQYSNYYSWLSDEDYNTACKEKFKELYEMYYNEEDAEKKKELFKQVEVYLIIVCDIIAYRYLVKHHIALFQKLDITVDEYINYKAKRLLTTIKNKKEHIDNVLNYIYMSFMLSSPRLIYDYGEKIKKCYLVKEELPYYMVARNRFFSEERENATEHVIFTTDTLYLDESQEDSGVRSNIDKYAYNQWKDNSIIEEGTDLQFLVERMKKLVIENGFNKRSLNYLISIFNNWAEIESDFQTVKDSIGNNNFSLLDYIEYTYSNNRTNLSYNEYLDVLHILNEILKIGR